ncbi:hypothetical protein HanRHA438_Chr12g0554751 [Helianthus annuus]|nr:hypothetical protein HanHA300_Chr12g0445221 [Helianthus annuus]KAJ0493409.1 hypothetical protein HanIR_Chr12g0585841 [Helianthus annuus]KAJ0505448.1 hypothetical protein HanHA89_Chr12g0470681 [Helianthus annuus]KAJ0866697.1 hypothetical protein HanRHA438_Chr12g0554751 [Helianthus annuus]
MTWRLKRSRLPDPLPEDFEFDRDLYAAMIKEVGRVQKFPEHILVMGRISTIWYEPEYYPTIKWNGKVSAEGDDDDAEVEVDQFTGFSVAGGLLENLDADLHSGKTPRDQPVNLPPSPLSFGGPTTKVIDSVNMLDPLAFKKIELSPSGKPTTGVASNVSRLSPQPIDGGDSAYSSPLWYETEAIFICRELGSGEAVDVDSAYALEKYVPDWSLVNKDRIMDAISAKMAVFHLDTPAEHAYYRKMSGPELGNALMLNQAQSNSLVVEAYKRLVEAESNRRRFEREVAFLKNEDNVRSKTKQELSLFRSQEDGLKEQVAETKEVSKASQASVAAAYEARDKAVRDLENVKLKFEELEKKLSEVEEKNKVKQKEMQSSYD